MRTYHPESYSQQARRHAKARIAEFEDNLISANTMVRFTQVSYQCPLVRRRVAKKFCRYFREHNIKVTSGATEKEASLVW